MTVYPLLARAGYRVITAAEGETGLRSARECAPDLIVLNMLLSKVTGLDELRTLKADDRTKHIPVIVLTSLSKGNADKLLKEGLQRSLKKSSKQFRTGLKNCWN